MSSDQAQALRLIDVSRYADAKISLPRGQDHSGGRAEFLCDAGDSFVKMSSGIQK